MILYLGRRYGKREACKQLIKSYVIVMIATEQGDKTLMIASPDDPVEKVPEMLWYDIDGVHQFEVIWHDRYKHPTKTFYEWAKELGIEM